MKKNENPVLAVLFVSMCAIAEVLVLAALFKESIDDQAARLLLAMVITGLTLYASLFKNKLALICMVLAMVISAVGHIGGVVLVLLASYFFHSLTVANPSCRETMREWILNIFRDEKDIEKA